MYNRRKHGWKAVMLSYCWAGIAYATSAGELQTQPVALEQVALEQRFEAVVEAVNRATVSAQTSGRIVEILFDVDDYVERGAVLIRLRATEQEARVKQARAGLEEAGARLREARDERERVAGIFARQLVSKAAMDKADAELRAAQARYESAQARVAEAKEQLEHTMVRAPYSGIVVERHVEVGETANPGQPLMTGLSLEQLRVVTALPQRYVSQVRDLAAGKVYDAAGNQFPSESVTVSPYAEPGSFSFEVRLDLAPGAEGLYPGMRVKAGFELGRAEQLLLPAQALVRRSEVTGAYVVAEDGRINFRQLRTGRVQDDGRVVVLAGVVAGEQVALDPIQAGVLLKQQLTETSP